MNKSTLYILFAIVAVSTVMVLWDSPQTILGEQDIAEGGSAIPFIVVHNANTIHYDESGEINYQFTAERLEHYREEDVNGQENPDGRYTQITTPYITMYIDDQPWYVRSKEGKILHQSDVLELSNEVLITHTDDKGLVTQLSTNTLNINPVKKFAQTAEPVKIHSAYGDMNAVGMEADFKSSKIKLLSDVRGQHDPF